MLKIYNSNKFTFEEIEACVVSEESVGYENSISKYNEMRKANAEDITDQIIKDFDHYDKKAVLDEVLKSFDVAGKSDSFELKSII